MSNNLGSHHNCQYLRKMNCASELNNKQKRLPANNAGNLHAVNTLAKNGFQGKKRRINLNMFLKVQSSRMLLVFSKLSL